MSTEGSGFDPPAGHWPAPGPDAGAAQHGSSSVQPAAPQHAPSPLDPPQPPAQHAAPSVNRGGHRNLRRVWRQLRPRSQMLLAGGAAAAVATLGAVVFVAQRDDPAPRNGLQVCSAEGAAGEPAGTSGTGDWTPPLNGAVVVEQGCAINGFQGYWDGDWGRIVLRVGVDGSVVGAYDHDDGLLVGTISNGVLSGKWCEAPSYAGGADAGLVEMRIVRTAGVDSIDGRWIFGTDTTAGWNDNWDVTGKQGEKAPAELAERLAEAADQCVGP